MSEKTITEGRKNITLYDSMVSKRELLSKENFWAQTKSTKTSQAWFKLHSLAVQALKSVQFQHLKPRRST